jgi:hypothetical protein
MEPQLVAQLATITSEKCDTQRWLEKDSSMVSQAFLFDTSSA